MKINRIRRYSIIAGIIILLGSCKVESENIFNMFDDVEVIYHGDHPASVTDYKEVNDGDDVYLDFTVISKNEDMYQINVLEVGSNTPFERIPITDPAQRRSYSGVVKLKADKRVGKTSYRIWPVNKDGIYMGDGYKDVTIYVKPNFTLYANRRVYLPDSAGTDRASYFSVLKGQSFSPSNGAANSGDIDFGLYRVWVDARGFMYNIYSLTADPLPFTLHNVSTWQKRETLFSAPVNGHANTFNNTLLTGSKIETEAKGKRINLKATTNGLGIGSAVYFLTPEGRYGVLLVNSITTDPEGVPFIDISVKIRN